jgi:chromosome segregation ATPase
MAGDVHMRTAPTAMGSLLQMPPNQSPIERALELSYKVESLRLENLAINQRVRVLEEGVQSRDRLLSTAARDVQDATAEVARVRRDLQTWVEELKQQQMRIRQLDKDYQELLKAVIRMLEKATASGEPEKVSN